MPALLSDVELLARLVAFDSTSSRSNQPIADFICDYLSGVARDILRIGPEAEKKANLVIALGPEPLDDRAGLILSGHMDVVPAVEPDWNSDPFHLQASGDRLFGRGTADMKGFLAVAMNLAARIEKGHLRAPLILIFTYDEEVGTLGARYLHDHWPAGRPLPRNTVIGEPTSLHPVRMHKGHLKLEISIEGKSAHSGYPHLGVNAIERALPLLQALSRLRAQLESERPANNEYFPEVPFAALNIGTIRGGTAVNIVPAACTVEVGVRLLPGMEEAAMVGLIEGLIVPLGGRVRLISSSPAMLLDSSSDIHVQTVRASGSTIVPSVSFATDGGWFQSMGLECVIFGPGSIEVAHRPNEFVPRDELHAAASALERLADHFCGATA